MVPNSNEERGYREPANRPGSVPARRWYVKHGDVEKGPFTAKMVARSVKGGTLHRASLVRVAGDSDWRPLGSVPALISTVHKRAPGAHDDPRETEWALAQRDGHRATIGSALMLLGGLLMLASGVLTLSGTGSIWIVLCALALAVTGMVMRKSRDSASTSTTTDKQSAT
jgi:hypothetical protein